MHKGVQMPPGVYAIFSDFRYCIDFTCQNLLNCKIMNNSNTRVMDVSHFFSNLRKHSLPKIIVNCKTSNNNIKSEVSYVSYSSPNIRKHSLAKIF